MDKDQTAEVAHVESVKFSRRSILQGAAHVGGAASLLAVTANRARAAAAKTTKQAAGYQNSPNGGQSCSTCIAFQPPNACRIVGGNVSSQGWCKVWQRKS
jgi:high potential iron-sulfur protein